LDGSSEAVTALGEKPEPLNLSLRPSVFDLLLGEL